MTASSQVTPTGAPARPILAGDAIARALTEHGVDRIFLMTGGDLSLWRALQDAGIQMCLARSEAGSVVMADAYARITGRTAVVYGQWGPGAANVAGALADAWWAGSPVLALTSTAPTTSQYKFEYQELEQEPMFAPLTKWQARINRADRAGELVAQGIRIAESGSPGPVHIDIPSDIVKQPLGIDQLPPSSVRPAVSDPGPSDEAVSAITSRLRTARRPVILAGGGVLASGGASALTALAQRCSLPVVTTMGGKGSIAEDHPMALGVAGRYSRRVANEVLADADFVLAVGTDLGGLATDTYTLPRASADVVQIDLDASKIGRTVDVSLGVVADARMTCAALNAALAAEDMPSHDDWSADVALRRAAWLKDFDDVAHRPAEGHVRPEAVAWILREIAGVNDIIVADTGFMGAWAGTLFPVLTTGRTFVRAAGTLGWAFPAVLGAQLGRPGVRAFALIGDGGIGYNVGDLETAVRLGIPAVTIVLNNACLAYEYVAYEIGFGGQIVDEVCDFDDVDYGAVARSFGAFGARVDSAEGFRTALKEAVAQSRPALIDVVVSKHRVAPVTSFDALLDRDL